MLNLLKLLILLCIVFNYSLIANGDHHYTHQDPENQHTHKDIKKVLVLKQWKPYYFVDEKGTEKGFAVDIFKRVATKANIHYEFVIVNSWPEGNKLIKEGKIDIIPNMGIT